MSEIIFHHYPQSPVAEKVRVGFGIKDLCWRSVHIPRLPPKPEVAILTGGYRRTPVMQIGADIYCDSMCILRKLEQHFPLPSFFPGANERWSTSSWTDGAFFDNAIAVVLGSEVDNLPPEFAADRGRLYFGPHYDLHAFGRDLPHLLGQLRAHLAMMQQMLGGSAFMQGARPGVVDALCYYLVWFIRGRYSGGPDLLSGYAGLAAWEQRVRSIGHGRSSAMSADQSLDVALNSTTLTESAIDPDEPMAIAADDLVEVTPDGDSGDPPVRGRLVVLTHDSIAVRRRHERVGEVVVHFPRVGYRLGAAGRTAP